MIQGDTLAAALDELRPRLAKVLRALRHERDVMLGRSPSAPGTGASVGATDMSDALKGVVATARAMLSAVMRQPTEHLRSEVAGEQVKAGTPGERLLAAEMAKIALLVQTARDASRRECHALLDTDSRPSATPLAWTTPEKLAQHILRHYYTWYELYDSMVFPLAYGSQVGEEIAPVEPVRVSPLRPHPVTHEPVPNPALTPSGITLGHFGAFLDEGWRGRDILIGRLNASEKLVTTVLAGLPYATADFVAAYVKRAQSAVIEEEFARADSYLERRLREVKAKLPTPDARLQHVLAGKLTAEELPRDRLLNWAARSTKVLGRMFDRAAGDDLRAKATARWVTRAGQAAALLAELALPVHWWGKSLRQIGVLITLFALFTLALGDFFGKHEVVTLGWQLLAVMVALGLATYSLGLWLRRKDLRIKILAAGAALFLMAFGARQAWGFLVERWEEVRELLPWR